MKRDRTRHIELWKTFWHFLEAIDTIVHNKTDASTHTSTKNIHISFEIPAVGIQSDDICIFEDKYRTNALLIWLFINVLFKCFVLTFIILLLSL